MKVPLTDVNHGHFFVSIIFDDNGNCNIGLLRKKASKTFEVWEQPIKTLTYMPSNGFIQSNQLQEIVAVLEASDFASSSEAADIVDDPFVVLKTPASEIYKNHFIIGKAGNEVDNMIHSVGKKTIMKLVSSASLRSQKKEKRKCSTSGQVDEATTWKIDKDSIIRTDHHPDASTTSNSSNEKEAECFACNISNISNDRSSSSFSSSNNNSHNIILGTYYYYCSNDH